MLQERLQALEVTANQLQAALLASLEEEEPPAGVAPGAKAKKKKSKGKTKRSKKNGSVGAASEAEAASEVDGSRSETEADADAQDGGTSGDASAAAGPEEVDNRPQATPAEPAAASAPDGFATASHSSKPSAPSSDAGPPCRSQQQEGPKPGQAEIGEQWQVVQKGAKRAAAKPGPKTEVVRVAEGADANNVRKRCMSSASLSSTCSADTDVSMPLALDHRYCRLPLCNLASALTLLLFCFGLTVCCATVLELDTVCDPDNKVKLLCAGVTCTTTTTCTALKM